MSIYSILPVTMSLSLSLSIGNNVVLRLSLARGLDENPKTNDIFQTCKLWLMA